MRVVLDTNILIRANPKARGPAREVLEKIASGNHVLVTSPFLLQEVARVLAYPRVEMRWRLRPQEVEQYLQILATVSDVVAPLSGGPIVLKDVDDDPIIYTAVAGRADVLCTLDAHFYEEPVLSFCASKGRQDCGRCRAAAPDSEPGRARSVICIMHRFPAPARF